MDQRVHIDGQDATDLEKPLLRAKHPRASAKADLRNLPIRRAEKRRSESRAHARHPLGDVHARVEFHGCAVDVDLLNLSSGGAMVACDLRPNLAEPLGLRLGQGDLMECLVRWVRQGRIGLEFAHETRLCCSAEEQAAVLREVIARGSGSETPGPVSELRDQRHVRSAPRHPLIWTGELVHGATRRKVRLRNMSQGGALVEGSLSVRAGIRLLLDLGDAGSIMATVKWTAAQYAGLEFEEPFELSSLARSKPRMVPHTWLRPAYLEKHVPEDSAWDQRWNRKSLAEVREELDGFLKY